VFNTFSDRWNVTDMTYVLFYVISANKIILYYIISWLQFALLRSHTTTSAFNKINKDFNFIATCNFRKHTSYKISVRYRAVFWYIDWSIRPTHNVCCHGVMLSWCDGVFVDFVIWQWRAWPQNSKTVVNFRRWNHDESATASRWQIKFPVTVIQCS